EPDAGAHAVASARFVVTTIYLIILCLALAATLAFVIAWLHDEYVARGSRGGRAAGEAATTRWHDGTIDRLLAMFPIAAAGLLLGLLLSGEDIDVLDLGAEAMLLAAGVTGAERLAARRRGAGSAPRRPASALLLIAAGAGVIGGLAGLGG
ncbi:MAG TPA: hypothetical protein VGV67_13330, partial [Solirubrobacteraceae bacterium]|nr:hypothetical protein [Solirubrobacteraceae bacterium]